MVLDLGDLYRRGELLKEQARAEASRILADAEAERARLIAGAREEGLAVGIAEGRKAGSEQGRKEGAAAALAERRDALAKLDANWAGAIRSFEEKREESFREAGEQCVRLALLIAERIVKHTLKLDPSIVAAQARAAISLAGQTSALVLSVNPEDEPIIREAMPGLAASITGAGHAQIVADPTVARGGVVVRTAGGEIDATIPVQAERIARELLGVDPAGGGA